jgi:hypothetical protein
MALWLPLCWEHVAPRTIEPLATLAAPSTVSASQGLRLGLYRLVPVQTAVHRVYAAVATAPGRLTTAGSVQAAACVHALLLPLSQPLQLPLPVLLLLLLLLLL